ncbi:sensor domain-containing diguanylate cyclase [Vibrio sonorensis]|uniref:sensor domain-containing diguanylate cyclase n=1 Tax=Vibrio sonorensis TaxID=1004316 RepID=UPI0008DA6EDA|nr:GGDEF domain-containing protein [Vibrio sonorensis]
MIALERIEDIYDNNQFTLHEFVLNQIGSYVFVKNHKGEYLYANQLTLELFATDLSSLKGKTDRDFFSDELIEDILNTDRQVIASKQTCISEERTKALSDDQVKIYRAIKSPILSSIDGSVIGLIGVSTDITDLVQLKEQLHVLANTDDLTQLSNRRKMWRTFANEFTLARDNSYPLSCISIDIDNFKLVNDTYGHAHGDTVIKKLADFARQQIRANDACGRIGGEEFLVILHQANAKQAADIAERLRKAFYNHEFFKEKAKFSISCGIAELNGTDQDFFSLYRRSDQALYQAKRSGRNQICVND